MVLCTFLLLHGCNISLLFLISKINFFQLSVVRYIYREITAFRTGDSDCILEHAASAGDSLLRVKLGTTFHLYVSAPPCGDASLFSR